jgi:hypothetical protein
MYPSLVSAHSHERHRDINVIFMHKRQPETSNPCPMASESSDNGHQSRSTPPKRLPLPPSPPRLLIWLVGQLNSPGGQSTNAGDGRWSFEMMCFYTTCDGRMGGVNVTINLFRPRFDRLVIETMGDAIFWVLDFWVLGSGNYFEFPRTPFLARPQLCRVVSLTNTVCLRLMTNDHDGRRRELNNQRGPRLTRKRRRRWRVKTQQLLWAGAVLKAIGGCHATINIKTRVLDVECVEWKHNAKQQSTPKRENGFADMFAVCTSCVSLLKSDNEYLTRLQCINQLCTIRSASINLFTNILSISKHFVRLVCVKWS